ncbi:MAG: hypothetical protein WA634_15535 [Silvibacterium sp.]
MKVRDRQLIPVLARLIGDQQPDPTKKCTFADFKPYHANSPLLVSGLLGRSPSTRS